MRSPIQPATGDSRAPASAAVPATSPIALARPGPRPTTSSTMTGTYGRDIWLARKAVPKIRKIPRTTRSPRTPRMAPKASVEDAARRDDLRPDLARAEGDERRRHQRQAGRDREDAADRPAQAVDEDAGQDRPDGEADRPRDAEEGDHRPEPRASAPRRGCRASMTPVLPSWKPMSSTLRATCHGSLARAIADEDDGLDERAPDDDRLAAVLVGPHAPERHEGHPEDEDQGAEEADELEPVAVGNAHRRELRRQQGEDLADAQALDQGRDPEDGHERRPPLRPLADIRRSLLESRPTAPAPE